MLPKFSENDLSGLQPSTLGDVVSAFDKPSPREMTSESFLSRRSSRRFSKSIIPADIPEEESTIESTERSRRESCSSSANEQEKDESKDESSSKMLPSNVTKPMIKYLEQKADSKKLTTDEFVRLLKKLEVEKEDGEVSDSLVRLITKLKVNGEWHQHPFNTTILEKMLYLLCAHSCFCAVKRQHSHQNITTVSATKR